MGNKKATLHYPVREWLGKFEKWILILKGSRLFRIYDRELERFFSAFPKKTNLEQFGSVDIMDYIALRKEQGASEGTIKWELCVIKQFWLWLTIDEDLHLNDVMKGFRKYKLLKERIKWSTHKGPSQE